MTMQLANPLRLQALARRAAEDDHQPCPEELGGRACRLEKGHGYNHNNGVASWGHEDALGTESCTGCGSDLVPCAGGWRCIGCGQDSAAIAPRPCDCGNDVVLIRPVVYVCMSCRRTAKRWEEHHAK